MLTTYSKSSKNGQKSEPTRKCGQKSFEDAKITHNSTFTSITFLLMQQNQSFQSSSLKEHLENKTSFCFWSLSHLTKLGETNHMFPLVFLIFLRFAIWENSLVYSIMVIWWLWYHTVVKLSFHTKNSILQISLFARNKQIAEILD